MNYSIVFSPNFDNDIMLLHENIVEISSSIETADNYIKDIFSKVNELHSHPNSGTKLFLDDYTDTGYRYIRYKKYLIFYMIIKDMVFIERVLYKGRDYIKILFD